MFNIISVVNQKGGVSKTTTSLALSVGFAKTLTHEKILLVDLDPQKNATSILTSQPDDDPEKSIYGAFKSGKVSSLQIQSTEIKNLFMIPASLNLVEIESMLGGKLDSFYRLQDAFENLKKEFTFIFFDCPPSLSVITINAMVASDYLVIPLQSSKFSVDGIQSILDSVNTIKKRYNANLKILGALMTMYDKRVTLTQVMAEEVKELLPLFKAKIPRSVVVEEAHLLKKNIYDYAPKSNVSLAYHELCGEILNELRK